MKRQIKKITKIMFACFFVGVILSACGDEGDEIFDNVDPQEEYATDQEDEVKSKPGKKIQQTS